MLSLFSLTNVYNAITDESINTVNYLKYFSLYNVEL